MKRQDRRSNCPTNFALQMFGDSWSLLIIRDLMFKGKHTFSGFATSEERIASNILTDRLCRLTKRGLIRKTGVGRATKYFLTRKGIDLLPMMVDMIVWSGTHDADSAVLPEFLQEATDERDALLLRLETELVSQHLETD